MAVDPNTGLSYDEPSNRESLKNVIYRISPTETPFTTGIETTGSIATNHEWPTEELPVVDASNAKLSGDDAVTSEFIPTNRFGNYLQISDKVPRVSGTQRATTTAGKGDELPHQTMLQGLALRRDMETIMLSTQSKLAGDSGTARNLAGVLSWIATNTNIGATGTDPTGDGTDSPGAGTPRAFDEAQLQDVLEKCWNEGGNPNQIQCGSFNKRAFNSFTGRAGYQPDEAATSKRLTVTVNVYDGDFGVQTIKPNRFCDQSAVYVFEMAKWGKAFLPGRNFNEENLAKTGDSDRKQILSEYTLEARNQKASGVIRDLTTA